MRKRSASWGVAIGSAAALALGGALLVATEVVFADATTVHACAKNSNGAVRLVDEGDACSLSEHAVSWGLQGPAGPEGPAGPSITFVQRSNLETINTGVWTAVESWCLPGEVVTGGGYSVSSIGFSDKINVTGPALSPAGDDGWVVNFNNESGFDIQVGVVAICAQYPA